jgi:ATP-dependent RNA helicase DDX27
LNGVRKRKEGKLSGKDKKRLDDRRERKEGKVWKKGKAERGAPPVGNGKAKGKGREGGGERNVRNPRALKAKGGVRKGGKR